MKTIAVGGELVGVPDDATPELMDRIAASHAASKRQGGQQDSARQVYEGTNPLAKLAVGVGASAAEPVLGLAQLATKGAERLGVPGAATATRGIEDRVASVRGAREGAGGWGTAGEVASWLAPGKAIAGLGGAALRKVAPKLAERGAAQLAAMTAGEGAVQAGYEASSATLADDPSRGERAKTGAAYGAGGAAGGAAVSKLAGRALAPVRTISPEAAELQRRAAATGVDIDLTPGQKAGRGSVMGSFEEGATAIPGIGSPIKRAREGAVQDWNLVQLREAAARLGPGAPLKITQPGTTGIEQLQGLVDDAYKGATRGVTIRVPAVADPFLRTRSALSGLPADRQAALEPMIDNLLDRARSGKLSGDDIIQQRSTLAKQARQAYLQGDGMTAEILDQLDDDFADVARYYMTPAQAKQWAAANKAYTRLKPINRAAGMAGAIEREGMFSPGQLRAGTARGMSEGGKAAQRSPLLRETVRAQQALGNTLPAPGPGTAEKLLTAGVLLGGGAGAQALVPGEPGPAGYAAAVGPAAAYLLMGTRGGRKYMTRPQGNRKALVDALRNYEGSAAAAGARLNLQDQE